MPDRQIAKIQELVEVGKGNIKRTGVDGKVVIEDVWPVGVNCRRRTGQRRKIQSVGPETNRQIDIGDRTDARVYDTAQVAQGGAQFGQRAVRRGSGRTGRTGRRSSARPAEIDRDVRVDGPRTVIDLQVDNTER